jgi:hypothetical protein
MIHRSNGFQQRDGQQSQSHSFEGNPEQIATLAVTLIKLGVSFVHKFVDEHTARLWWITDEDYHRVKPLLKGL